MSQFIGRTSTANLRRWLLVTAFTGSSLYLLPAQAAQSCSFSAINSVSFGVYDVNSPLNNNNGVGSLNIRCQGGGSSATVTLSTGQSNRYSSRQMKSGSDSLNYNLYTSATRTVVWGNGMGGSSTMSADPNSNTTLSIFGMIPANQDAAVGIYTDSMTAIINF